MPAPIAEAVITHNKTIATIPAMITLRCFQNGALTADAATPINGARHLAQNFAPTRFGFPQFSQYVVATGAACAGAATTVVLPHLAQNFAPARIGLPQ
jgi:hypothetical protein